MIAIRDNLSGGVSRCKQISNLAVTVGFSAPGTIVASWTNPSDAKYKGVRILYKIGGYPTSPTDGSVFYDSNDAVPVSSFTKSGFADGTRYYLRAFAYTYKNATRLYTTIESGAQANGVPLQVKGQQIFTSSGLFSVPAGVTAIDVFLVGGGGGSGQDYTDGYSGAGGGYTKTHKSIPTSPEAIWNVLVGSGGLNANGGASSFSNSSANYIAAGGNKSGQDGASGGSGGGGGGQYSIYAGNGGADGSKGADARKVSTENGTIRVGGAGQGTTTRAFGESTGTLYAGGGGGAWSPTGYTGSVGQGGAGGGGRGQETRSTTTVATGGTPNTGGGAGGHYGASAPGQGGSGIVIVRWGY